jgi:hypothetical protein
MNIKFIPFTIPYRMSKSINIYSNDIYLFNSTKYLNYSNNNYNKTLYKIENILEINKGNIKIIQSNNKLLFINESYFDFFNKILTSKLSKNEKYVSTIFNYGVINFGFINKKNKSDIYQIDLDKNQFYEIYKDINNKYIYFNLQK